MKVEISVRGPFRDPNHQEDGEYIRIHFPDSQPGFVSISKQSEGIEKNLYDNFRKYAD
jgi:hypothetical protein